jgi:hypothetical protein
MSDLDDQKWRVGATWPSPEARRVSPPVASHTLPDPIAPPRRTAVQEQALLDHAQQIGALKSEVAHMTDRIEDMDKKLDQIIAAANMGKGAWLAAVKAGGIIATLGAGAAWLWGHLQTFMHR